MPIDLRQFRQKSGEWDWVERETKRLGDEDKLLAMRNAMFNAIYQIPPGSYIDIEKSVKPENREMFVKTACEFLTYPEKHNYRFNRLMNKLHHDEPIILNPKDETKENRKEREAMERARRRLPANQR